MPAITSLSNSHIASLRALHTAKGRHTSGAFLVEGPHLLEATLEAGVLPTLVLFASDALERGAAGRRLLGQLEAARAAGGTILEATEQVVARACDTQTPQGIVAAVALGAVAPDAVRARRRGRARPLVLLLDALSDPGNLGTLLRSALAADVDEVWLGPGCADWLAPKVVRAGSGAHFHLPVRAALSWEAIAQRVRGAPRVQQVLLAEAASAQPYDQFDLTQRTILIVGNEAHGPSPEAGALATARVAIPMWNRVESLNAATAASVILFEAGRQRRAQQFDQQSDQELNQQQRATPATTERVDDESAQGGKATD
jgi:TrmH family RNA methyltransferase